LFTTSVVTKSLPTFGATTPTLSSSELLKKAPLQSTAALFAAFNAIVLAHHD